MRQKCPLPQKVSCVFTRFIRSFVSTRRRSAIDQSFPSKRVHGAAQTASTQRFSTSGPICEPSGTSNSLGTGLRSVSQGVRWSEESTLWTQWSNSVSAGSWAGNGVTLPAGRPRALNCCDDCADHWAGIRQLGELEADGARVPDNPRAGFGQLQLQAGQRPDRP
jgi:hypothetical protein